VVRDATTGETLYDRNGDQRMLPASNTKLFTSTAAMHVLGPSYRLSFSRLSSFCCNAVSCTALGARADCVTTPPTAAATAATAATIPRPDTLGK